MWPFKSTDKLDNVVRKKWQGQWHYVELYTYQAKADNSSTKTAKYIYSLVKELSTPVIIFYTKEPMVRLPSNNCRFGDVRYAWPVSEDIDINFRNWNFINKLNNFGFIYFFVSQDIRQNFDEVFKFLKYYRIIRCNFNKQ